MWAIPCKSLTALHIWSSWGRIFPHMFFISETELLDCAVDSNYNAMLEKAFKSSTYFSLFLQLSKSFWFYWLWNDWTRQWETTFQNLSLCKALCIFLEGRWSFPLQVIAVWICLGGGVMTDSNWNEKICIISQKTFAIHGADFVSVLETEYFLPILQW